MWMDLQLFAESGSGEKTEKASPRKKEKAREEGKVAKSVEVTTALMLVGMFSTLKFFGPIAADRLRLIFIKSFKLLNTEELTIPVARRLYSEFLMDGLMVVLPIFAVAVSLALIANVAQVGFKISPKALQPKLSSLNPISGFKRIFSLKTIVELVKSIIKIVIIMTIVYNTIKGYEQLIFNFYDLETFEAYGLAMNLVLDLGIKVGAFFIIVAVLDYGYTRYKYEKDLKMTKQEVKEENKMAEGNPEIKSKIRQKMREVAMRRMMQDLPKADVIITNPTHFAVALSYNELTGKAPVVLAKGKDLVAYRIREKAKQYNIQLIEDKPLARTLYYTVEIGEEIPPELYQAVAKILALVYSIKEKGVSI